MSRTAYSVTVVNRRLAQYGIDSISCYMTIVSSFATYSDRKESVIGQRQDRKRKIAQNERSIYNSTNF